MESYLRYAINIPNGVSFFAKGNSLLSLALTLWKRAMRSHPVQVNGAKSPMMLRKCEHLWVFRALPLFTVWWTVSW